jgi:omega-6 fatty acid desaturase (delta-12 desaturase)
MYLTLDISYWITLGLAIPAAGFLARSFIIFHDCGHGSFFKSRKANRTLGFFAALLTFMPSYYWSHEHAKHHATAGDLDHRGNGDIWTLTVQEYLALSRWKRIWYRTYRNPIFLFGVAPLYVFFVRYRYWRPGDNTRVRWSAMRTNVALFGIVTAASLTIGFKAYLMVQLPIMFVAGAVGVWLFYVQHQFENTYCAHPPMVQRQHRFPPRSPSEPANSELQPAEVPRIPSDVPGGETPHSVVESEVPWLSSLGRGAQDIGGI